MAGQVTGQLKPYFHGRTEKRLLRTTSGLTQITIPPSPDTVAKGTQSTSPFQPTDGHVTQTGPLSHSVSETGILSKVIQRLQIIQVHSS